MARSPTDDPFDLLSLPPVFGLDAARIERAALARLSQLHPDVNSGDAADDLEVAAARINAARDALTFALSRAEILLRRLGGPSKEADKTLPPGFLMEVMDMREQVEAAVASGDAAARATWIAWSLDQRREMQARANDLFAAADTDPTALLQLRVHLNQWRYIERLIEQLDPAYDPGQSDVGGAA